MMTCTICGDTNGPWEYETYKNENGKPWLVEDGTTVLVCEDCAKIIRKRLKDEAKKHTKDRKKWMEVTYK